MRTCLPSLLALLLLAGIAPADGGTVRFAGTMDGRRITVFTSPTPLRAGPVDVSVLVQDDAGRPLPDATVTLELIQGERVIQQSAVTSASTNQLLHSAKFDLPTSGRWRLEVRVLWDGRESTAACEVEAAEMLPRWTEMAPWIALPAAVIALYVLHQAMTNAKRKHQRR